MIVLNSMFGNNLLMTEKSMDYLWVKQTATLNNIANVDTPGYKTKLVTFEDLFRNRLKAAETEGWKGIRDAITQSNYRIYDDPRESSRADANNVNADLENVELVRSTLQYQYTVNAFNSDVSRLRSVIREGR